MTKQNNEEEDKETSIDGDGQEFVAGDESAVEVVV
jgi:hypothetical protein